MGSRDNKTTGEHLKAIEDEIDDLRRGRTPAVGVPVTRDDVFEIAEKVVARSRAAEQKACELDGPACRLGKEFEGMEKRLKDVEDEQAREQGRRQRSAWIVTVAMALIALGGVTAAWAGALRRDEKSESKAAELAKALNELRVEISNAAAARKSSQLQP